MVGSYEPTPLKFMHKKETVGNAILTDKIMNAKSKLRATHLQWQTKTCHHLKYFLNLKA